MFLQVRVRNVEVGISCETKDFSSIAANQSADKFGDNSSEILHNKAICVCFSDFSGVSANSYWDFSVVHVWTTAVIVEPLWQLVLWFLFALFFHCFVNQSSRQRNQFKIVSTIRDFSDKFDFIIVPFIRNYASDSLLGSSFHCLLINFCSNADLLQSISK